MKGDGRDENEEWRRMAREKGQQEGPIVDKISEYVPHKLLGEAKRSPL